MTRTSNLALVSEQDTDGSGIFWLHGMSANQSVWSMILAIKERSLCSGLVLCGQ
jgi:hypothetical protein